MEENLKEDSQVNPLSPQQEEIQKRREAVLLRQKELQQKSSSPPWEDSIKQQPSQPIKPWQSQVQSQPQTQTSTQTSPPIGSVQPVNIPSNNFSNQPTVREENVKNAVEFLTDSRVMSSTKEKKSAFLRSKGLTQPEIDEAFRRAESQIPQQQAYSAPSSSVVMPPRPMVRYTQSPTQVVAQIPWKALAFLLVICAGIGGAISWLIKRYIFTPKTKSLKESQDETIKNLQKKLDDVNAQLEKQAEEMKHTLNYIHSFLLNKKEFPRDNLDKTETLKSVIQEVSDTVNFSIYPSKLPESPLLKTFPELRSDLIYAKQILSTATNTPLLEIPKKTPSNNKALNPFVTSPFGATLNSSTYPKPSLSNSLPATANKNQSNSLANSATKADINWLYNMPQNKKVQSEKLYSRTNSAPIPSTASISTKDSEEPQEDTPVGKQENVDTIKT